MDQIRLRLSIFLLVSVAFSVNTLAQDTRGWIGNGLGASLAGGGVGYSIVLHANLNKEQSFVGLTFGVTVGKQRR